MKNSSEMALVESLKLFLAESSRKPTSWPEYMSTKVAAAYLDLSVVQLEKWRMAGDGPAYSKLAKAVRYRRTDLDAYMASRRVGA